MEFMVDMLDKVQAERLPYIVAVTGGAGSSAVVHTAGRSSATPATIGDAEGAGKGNSDLVLGYIYAVPYYSYEGFSVRTGTLSAYIHPELRMSGLGGRLCRLMLNLLKCPTRYTSPPSSCSSSTTPTTSLPLSDNDEENIATYTAWKNIPLRPLKTVVVCTIIDTEGIGMGKDRFFEKMGYHKVGIVTACMEKFAKIWDKGIWAMQLENWDEVKGRPKINRRSDAAAMNGGGSGWQMETKERVKEEERLGHLLIRSML